MSVPRSPGQATPRTADRSIYFYLFVRLIMPVVGLALLWGLVAAAILTGYPHRWHWLIQVRSGHGALTGAAVIGGTGIAVVLAAVVLLGLFARRLTREVNGLTMTARRLAEQQLPEAVTPLRDGQRAAAPQSPKERPRPSVTQIAAAADAIAGMHRSAVAAAVAEAGLRSGFRKILVSLGKRNQSLLYRQLRIIDTLEQQAASPAALADLFTLDHLTTRMRRHAESLTILSGAAAGRSWNGPVPVIDVMRAAAAEVEDYTRVTVVSESDEAVAAPAVVDMIHLLAELIENATLFSPSSTRVEVRADRVANGFAIEVEDRGLGIPPDQLRELNAQLASPPDFDSADADRLGLFVAGRLAAKHGVYVSLALSPYRGIKAVVVLPEGVVIPAPQPHRVGKPVALADARSVRLSLRLPEVVPEVLSLASPVMAGLPAPGTPLQADAPPDSRPGAQRRAADEPTALTVRGLPKRVRPGSQPQDERGTDAGAATPAVRQAPVESPAPDAARSLAASLQSSWQRSRQVDDRPDSGSTAGERLSARHDTPRQDTADALTPDTALDSED
jgi:signal transduction histidine kinase